ncbi:nitroreductase family protein [Patescibacteria group bacterium]|nr:nitroreductase family protein [Patescibacteria group bacterium]MCL5798366.1 nitroreductase family protein [Patescibacteria group bacterium]
MNTLDAIHSRRAVRNYTDKEIPNEVLAQILEAGRYSPSPLNSQPWHMIVLQDRDTIGKLSKNAHHGPFLSQARVVVIVVVDNNAKTDQWLAQHKQHIYSGVCAMENMWLAAWDFGVGCCWVTVDEKYTREILEIPINQILLGSLVFGFPKGEVRKHIETDRKPIDQIVFYEKYGNIKQ